MIHPDNINQQQNDIEDVLRKFYHAIESKNPDEVFEMLSPNLQRFALLESARKKFQVAFKFGRKLHSIQFFDLKEIKQYLFEVIVAQLLVPANAKVDFKPEDIGYAAFKVQLINIDTDWFIDDIIPYDEFWKKEILEHYKSFWN